jgi:hypothetical protein
MIFRDIYGTSVITVVGLLKGGWGVESIIEK